MQRRHVPIPGVYHLNATKPAMPKREYVPTTYRSLSTSSGGRRWNPVVFLTASTPRQITVDTVELRSRTELPRLTPLFVEASSGRVSSPDQFASTSSSSKIRARLAGAEAEMGIGKEAEGESLRISAACA